MVRDLQLVSRRRPHGNGSTGAGGLGLSSLRVLLLKVLGMSFAGCWEFGRGSLHGHEGFGVRQKLEPFSDRKSLD